MPFFSKSPRINGVQLFNIPENQRKNLIYLVDMPKKKKKNSSGVLDLLMGDQGGGEPKSAITLAKVTMHLRKIESIPSGEPINIFMHTLGGSSLACELLVRALLNHPGRIRVYIPQYAFSAGTMIALAADEIYMSKNAVLGPVDPQALDLPINSVMDSLTENKDKKGFISAFMSSYVTKVKEDYDRTLEKVLRARFGENFNKELMDHFNEDHHHGYQIDVEELRGLGIEVNDIQVKWRNLSNITECDIRPIEPPNEEPVLPVNEVAAPDEAEAEAEVEAEVEVEAEAEAPLPDLPPNKAE